MERNFSQQDTEGGVAGTRVLQNIPQLPLKDEQLIDQMRHERILVDHL